ncbi:ROK family protein [Leptospira ognonensis]|uniref:ROK family protein n=1 Tax=Leptospira ognonensis TaxID=2484945 RepID=A0A4R9KDD7_9LEPT|nr:ROK family protein [Leptospira ognonensis]TGL63955.1 ROK family protein [Leptospira ognonensis]
MKEALAIGIDIGGGSIKTGVFDRLGKEYKLLNVPNPSPLTNESFLASIDSAIITLHELYPIAGIGIGSPGPLDNELGILIKSANMPSLQNVKLKEHLETKFHLPVFYENDANCAALGEATFGAFKNLSSQLILTLGTGVGGGFVEQGKLYLGYKGNGIEIGHMTVVIDGALCGCGQKGCLEAYFSTKGFLNRFFEKTKVQLKDAESFFTEVRKENQIAIDILNFGTVAMAETVRNAIHLLNPEALIFVGGITHAWDLFGENLESLIRTRIFPVLNERLIIGVGGNLAGSLGAASLVFQR